MTKHPAPPRHFLAHSLRQWGLAALIAVVMSGVAAYVAWDFVITPANQQRFELRVKEDVQAYQQSLEAYLQTIVQPLPLLARSVPADLFDRGEQATQDWITLRQSQWLGRIPQARSVNIFSVEDVQAQAGSALSFIVIDMLNRLERGEDVWVEVAKESQQQWLLHKIEPIFGQQGVVRGVIYVTYNLYGVQNIFSVNQQRAKIVLRQFIGRQAALEFLTLHANTDLLPQKVVNIPKSYWQLSYQPSLSIAQETTQIPLWFWLMLVIIPIVIMVITLGFIFPRVEPIHAHPHEAVKTEPHSVKDPESVIPPEPTRTPLTAEPVDSIIDAPEVIAEHIFRAYDIRGIAETEFTDELAYMVGRAVASEVLAAGDSAMVVGRDARVHSQELALCAIEGILSTGCDVYDLGLVPTPLMNFSACQHEHTSSGLIITASHNPAQYNGCKMVVKGNTLVDEDIQRLKARIQTNDMASAKQKGVVKEADFSQAYIDYISSDVAILDGWRIVIDAGNGAASQLAPRLFNAFDCQVTPLFCEFDGNFPNHDPDPSNPDNLKALIEQVKSSKADIGFAFDGDGDRLMVVTAKGQLVWPDQLMMLFAQDIVARHPGSDVVFDIKSTQLLSQVIAQYGGRPVMWKTGHSHIKAKMKETQALLGGEFSGHIFFKERWFGFDDGLYAAARLLEILTLTGQTMDQLLESLPTTIATREIKIAVDEADKFSLVQQLIDQPSLSGGKLTTIDGLRVDYPDGWGLVRASNTAAVLTLRFEAKTPETLQQIKSRFNAALNAIGHALPDQA